MTLDEAIKHAEEVAEEKRYEYQDCLAVHDMENAMVCGKCGEEHEQLAEWLKELKKFREQEPCEDWHDVPSDEMTLGQARQAVKDLRKMLAEYLWQEHCEDAISKAEVIKLIDKHMNDDGTLDDDITCILEELPPIQPKAKMGKWVEMGTNDDSTHNICCGACGLGKIKSKGAANSNYTKEKYKYCPNCGAKMEVEDCISKANALRVAKNEYLRGWHDALCKALSEKYSIHCEESNFSVIQEETIVGLGLSMDCAVGKDVESYMSTFPPVTPTCKKGKWISIYGNIKDGRSVGKATHYCDFCGAKMEEVKK